MYVKKLYIYIYIYIYMCQAGDETVTLSFPGAEKEREAARHGVLSLVGSRI